MDNYMLLLSKQEAEFLMALVQNHIGDEEESAASYEARHKIFHQLQAQGANPNVC